MTPPQQRDDETTPRRPRARVAGQRAAARRALAREDPTPDADTRAVGALGETDDVPPARPEPDGGRAPEDAKISPARPRGRLRRLLALGVVLALVAAASALGVRAWQRHTRVQERSAARAQAVAAAEKALPAIFSYDYRHLDADFARARAFLTGDFAQEYAKTTSGVVRQPAQQYKVTVVASLAKDSSTPLVSVVAEGRDRVVLLAFIDQVTTSTRITGQRVDHNRVRVTLERVGGAWKVARVDAL